LAQASNGNNNPKGAFGSVLLDLMHIYRPLTLGLMQYVGA
jgi:hypothetical protein